MAYGDVNVAAEGEPAELSEAGPDVALRRTLGIDQSDNENDFREDAPTPGHAWP